MTAVAAKAVALGFTAVWFGMFLKECFGILETILISEDDPNDVD